MKNYFKKYPENFILFFILVLAAILRFNNYSSFSLFNDELSVLNRLRFDSLRELIIGGIWVEGHPAGVQIFLFYWIKLFGISEASIRLPFVISGIIAIFFAYLTASKWFNKTTGLFVALSLSFLQFPIIYSQLARPYGSGLMLSLMLTYFWTIILFEDKKRTLLKNVLIVLGFSLSIAANLYNHYFSALLTGIIGVTGLFFVKRFNYKKYIFGGLAGLVLFLPHIPITLNHFKIGGVGEWLGKPEPDWLFEHIKFCFNDSITLLFIFIGILFFTIVFNWKKITFSKFHIISLIWFFVPFLIGYFYSVFVNPVLQNSVLIFSMPFLFFFIFSFFDRKINFLKITFLILLAVTGVYNTVVAKDFYNTQHFGEFKGIAKTIVEWNNNYGENNITNTININNPYYIDYYLEKYNEKIKFEQYYNHGGEDILEMKRIVSRSQTTYFIYARLKWGPAEIPEIIKTNYPFLSAYKNYNDFSEIFLFSENKTKELVIEHKPIKKYFDGFENFDNQNKIIDTINVFSGNRSFCLKGIEFSPAYSEIIQKSKQDKYSKIKINIWGLVSDELNDLHLVLALSEKEGETFYWISYDFKYYIEKNKWGQVFMTIDFPELEYAQNELKIYVWNPKKQNAFIDDFEIEFFK